MRLSGPGKLEFGTRRKKRASNRFKITRESWVPVNPSEKDKDTNGPRVTYVTDSVHDVTTAGAK